MIKLRNMILIGSSGRKSGKTRLACALIKKNADKMEITGLKVTTIKERNGECPRGGRGCGVCSALKENYLLTEEHSTKGKKDTALLLKSGAKKVFWLQAV